MDRVLLTDVLRANCTGWGEDHTNKYMPFIPSGIDCDDIYKDNNWITGDLRVIEISKMTTDHILSCINMIERTCDGENLNCDNYKVYNNLKLEVDHR